MTELSPEFAAALVEALAELTLLEKAHTATVQGKEGKQGYKYAYADLGDLVALTRPVLAQRGLVALTPVSGHLDGLCVTVELYHSSGEVLRFDPLTFPAGRDAQTTGSWITYMRRYALLAALGMAAGDDDDGAKAVAASSAPEDDYVPGLRTSVVDAIAKLDDDGKADLKAWFASQDLPAVRKMNGEQLSRTIDYLMSPPPYTPPKGIPPDG